LYLCVSIRQNEKRAKKGGGMDKVLFENKGGMKGGKKHC
jgi:hypothetical protein